MLTERLRALGRLEWAVNECDQVLGDRTPARVPEEAWWKLGDIRSMSGASRAVAQEVAAWRERTAAESNRPRRMVLSDLGLLALSQRPPRNADELRRTRGVDGRHLAQGRAAEILRAVERGLDLEPEQHPDALRGPRRAGPGGGRGRLLGVVRQIADDLDFDQGLLATRADLAELLCGEPGRLDSGWRRTIVGDPLAASSPARSRPPSTGAAIWSLRALPELADGAVPPLPVGLAELVLLQLARGGPSRASRSSTLVAP